MNLETTLTLTAFAAELGVCPKTARRYVERAGVQTVSVGNARLISAEDQVRVRRHPRPKVGSPGKVSGALGGTSAVEGSADSAGVPT